MNGYNYSPLTGEYASSVELRESPLEAGIFLVPACCTTTALPEVPAGHVACWNGSAWALVEDHRGEAGYVNGAAFEVVDLGPYPEGWSTEPPQPDPNAAILAQIAVLEALQTPRLVREAMKKKACVVNKPGTIIHGLSPDDAMDALDEALEALRAQLVGDVYYQGE
jgi:hypothetical protein